MTNICPSNPNKYRSVRRYLPVLFLLCLGFSACKKDSAPPGTAALAIVNAVVGSNDLITNFKASGPVTYYTANHIRYNKFAIRISDADSYRNQFVYYSGRQQLRLFEYPDTTAQSIPVFDLTLDLPIGSMKTLYLTGTLNAPDTVFREETLPFYSNRDSVMGIRFVNLSPGSAPVSVNLKGQTATPIESLVPYKSISGFKEYAVRTGIDDHVFEFRDAATGTLLASYTTLNLTNNNPNSPNDWLAKRFTLALLGAPGGTGSTAQTILLVRH